MCLFNLSYHHQNGLLFNLSFFFLFAAGGRQNENFNSNTYNSNSRWNHPNFKWRTDNENSNQYQGSENQYQNRSNQNQYQGPYQITKLEKMIEGLIYSQTEFMNNQHRGCRFFEQFEQQGRIPSNPREDARNTDCATGILINKTHF